jgi:hypothetical protein
MKKIKLIGIYSIICFIAILGIMSCSTIDRGVFSSDDVSEEDLVTLYIDKYIIMSRVNGETVDWKALGRLQILKIPSGMSSFMFKFNSAVGYTNITASLDKSKTYILTYKIHSSSNTVSYHVHLFDGKKKGSEIPIFGSNSSDGWQSSPITNIANFTQYVLVPTSRNLRKTVELSHADYTILIKPDLQYSLTNNITNTTYEGIYAFIVKPDTNIATLYFKEAQMELVLVSCRELFSTIIFADFMVEKPENLKGRRIIFSIKEHN